MEVNNKASDIACRAELGRFPLNITINQKILKYILYIQSKDEQSLVKQAFLMSFDLHCNGKKKNFNRDLLDIAMVKSYVSSMKQEYISYWQNTVQRSQKLESSIGGTGYSGFLGRILIKVESNTLTSLTS